MIIDSKLHRFSDGKGRSGAVWVACLLVLVQLASLVRLATPEVTPRPRKVGRGLSPTRALVRFDARQRVCSALTGRGRAEPPTKLLEGYLVTRPAPVAASRRFGWRDGVDDSEGQKKPSVPMTQKQLGQTVIHGRKVTLRPPDADPITGYLCGWDDENYYIVEPLPTRIRRQLVAKHGLLIELHREDSYASEPPHLREEMEEIVRPFRGWVSNNVFGGRPRDHQRKAANHDQSSG